MENSPITPTPNNTDKYMKKLNLAFQISCVTIMVVLIIILMLWNVINNRTVEFICLGVFLGLLVIDIVIFIVLRYLHKKKIKKENQ